MFSLLSLYFPLSYYFENLFLIFIIIHAYLVLAQQIRYTTRDTAELSSLPLGARCNSVVRAFAHGAMGHRIDPSV